MLKISLGILLFTCCCPAGAANAPAITVFVDFENQPSQESVAQMKTEVAAILAPSGLSLNWLSLNNRNSAESFPDLVVVKFRGTCQVHNPAMDSELGPAMEHIPLASTAVEDGHVLPFSDVRCDEIRRFLAPELAGTNPPKRESMYGKALGRVVAHELYHMLAATEKHGKAGVARQSHSRRDLTDRYIPLFRARNCPAARYQAPRPAGRGRHLRQLTYTRVMPGSPIRDNQSCQPLAATS